MIFSNFVCLSESPNFNEGLGLLKLADTLLILINPNPSNVNISKSIKLIKDFRIPFFLDSLQKYIVAKCVPAFMGYCRLSPHLR